MLSPHITCCRTIHFLCLGSLSYYDCNNLRDTFLVQVNPRVRPAYCLIFFLYFHLLSPSTLQESWETGQRWKCAEKFSRSWVRAWRGWGRSLPWWLVQPLDKTTWLSNLSSCSSNSEIKEFSWHFEIVSFNFSESSLKCSSDKVLH